MFSSDKIDAMKKRPSKAGMFEKVPFDSLVFMI